MSKLNALIEGVRGGEVGGTGDFLGTMHESSSVRDNRLWEKVSVIKSEMDAMMRDVENGLHQEFDKALLYRALGRAFDEIRQARNKASDRRKQG